MTTDENQAKAYNAKYDGFAEYKYNEFTGQWERVVSVEVVEDTYKETRDFEHFEI